MSTPKCNAVIIDVRYSKNIRISIAQFHFAIATTRTTHTATHLAVGKVYSFCTGLEFKELSAFTLHHIWVHSHLDPSHTWTDSMFITILFSSVFLSIFLPLLLLHIIYFYERFKELPLIFPQKIKYRLSLFVWYYFPQFTHFLSLQSSFGIVKIFYIYLLLFYDNNFNTVIGF